jgi:hypothetical protein
VQPLTWQLKLHQCYRSLPSIDQVSFVALTS